MTENTKAKFELPNHDQHQELINHLEKFSNLLDQSLTIPGTKIKVGIDSIVGLIPAIGDSIGLISSAYIIIRALKLNLPKNVIAKMVINVLIDYFVGSIPIIGDIFDISWKTNVRNIKLIKKYSTKL